MTKHGKAAGKLGNRYRATPSADDVGNGEEKSTPSASSQRLVQLEGEMRGVTSGIDLLSQSLE
eukprot:7952597-Lingulodinium_polyedra.AAC.1